MKHKGSHFEYEAERGENLLKVYRQIMSESDGTVMQEDIYRRVVMQPAARFWVSEERALTVLYNMRKDYHGTLRKMYPLKRKMYKEIYRRTEEMITSVPGMTKRDAVSLVVSSPAPEFYLTPGSAEVILCKLKRREWCLKRKQKLRHLF